jgi:hypothetical protein
MERPIEKLKQLQGCDLEIERKNLMIECDMLQGNINRMMVTDDHEELLTMFAYAHKRLGDIYWQNKKRINLKNIQEQTDGNNT